MHANLVDKNQRWVWRNQLRIYLRWWIWKTQRCMPRTYLKARQWAEPYNNDEITQISYFHNFYTFFSVSQPPFYLIAFFKSYSLIHNKKGLIKTLHVAIAVVYNTWERYNHQTIQFCSLNIVYYFLLIQFMLFKLNIIYNS